MASNQTNRRNAVRFDLLEDLQMDRLQFSRHILQKELDFASNHLEYIFAYPGKKIFEVIFTTSQHFQNCLERFEKKKKSASCFDKISMTPLAERDLKTVYVMIFSEKVRNQDVWTWMTRHCEVLNAIEVMDIDGIKTGSRRFQVRLQRQDGVQIHIPNTIQLGAFRGSVFYHGQPKECRKCGSLDHLAADCNRNICRICKATDHSSANCPTPVKCNLCSSENHRFKDCPHAYSNRVKLSLCETPQARDEERANEETELSQAPRSGTNQEPTNNVSQQPTQEPIQDQEKETSEGESIIDWSADTVEDIIDMTYIPLPMAHATVQKEDPLPNHHPGTRNGRNPGTLQDAENMLESIMANITTPPRQGKQIPREDPPDKAQASAPLVRPFAINQINDARDSPSRKRPQELTQSGEPSPSYEDSPSPTSNPLLEPEDVVTVPSATSIKNTYLNKERAIKSKKKRSKKTPHS